ncbi:UDP-2,3-diacylglucosamine diphosphatase LpxI [Candidatus Pelagibacter sp.]|nr:UDP-2,3-diacylglucosamine diphosphatase LpxI [Candidatus Pelagibacter sp.]
MIGLIFGDTDLPLKILEKIRKNKIKHLIIDLSNAKKFKRNKNSYSISIGEFGKIIKIIKDNNCKKVLFAGKIIKPKFSKLKLDLKGLYYMPSIIKASKLGDAAILKKIISILNKEKIKVIRSTFFNPELNLAKGNYTKIKPNKSDQKEITKGIKILGKLNPYSHTQGLIVRGNKVLVKENLKGTKKMILSIKKKKINSGILIKYPKKKQDLRIDLPTIGIETIKDCKKTGLKGIILKAKQNIVLDKKKCVLFANKNKMFINVQ